MGLEILNITPLTHLAISLAYGRFTSDGLISGNAILTPSLIYQASHRVKQLLKLSNG
jgi:energy-converting hydrogenase Eha subunit G